MITNSPVPLFISSSSKKNGFTLIEIVTVITIIVILIGILVRSILSIQRKEKVAQSEVLFHNLINSLTQYRKDNGGYLDVAGTLMGGDVFIDLNNGDQWKRFAEIRSLSLPDGSSIENPQNNSELKRYFDFQLSQLEMVDGVYRLVDAFGNPHIIIVVDANLDGRISRESLPDGEKRDLRQRIVIFTTDKGKDDFPELRTSAS